MEAESSPAWFIDEIRRLEGLLRAAGIDDQGTLRLWLDAAIQGAELSPLNRTRFEKTIEALNDSHGGHLLCSDIEATLRRVESVYRLMQPIAGQLATKVAVWLKSPGSRSTLAGTEWSRVEPVLRAADDQLSRFVRAVNEPGETLEMCRQHLRDLICGETQRTSPDQDKIHYAWEDIKLELDDLALIVVTRRLRLRRCIDRMIEVSRLTHERIDRDLTAWELGQADQLNWVSSLDSLHAGAEFLRDLGRAILDETQRSGDFRHAHLGPALLERVEAARIAAAQELVIEEIPAATQS